MVDKFYKIESWCNKRFNNVANYVCWHVLKSVLNITAPIYYKTHDIRRGQSCKKYVDEDVIISMTTFPERLKTLPMVLESLFRQTVYPTKIILWLANNQFTDKEAVKSFLMKYIKLGLEIRYCDDLRSHKKYYYTMKENPNALVVTFDDDIFAPEDMLERLLITYTQYPNCIVTQRAHEMIIDKSGIPVPYNNWNRLAKDCKGPSRFLCATGGAGCLYFPGALSEHVFDKEAIKALCFQADDIWLKCMSFLNGVEVVLTSENNPEIIDIKDNKKNGLAKQNVEQGLNDIQLQAVSNYYGIDWSKDYGSS